jgi:hypothetical protein
MFGLSIGWESVAPCGCGITPLVALLPACPRVAHLGDDTTGDRELGRSQKGQLANAGSRAPRARYVEVNATFPQRGNEQSPDLQIVGVGDIRRFQDADPCLLVEHDVVSSPRRVCLLVSPTEQTSAI